MAQDHAATQPEEAPSAQALVAGRFRLLERLGAGGMGVVYKARDEALSRDVAFKQLQLSAAASGKRTLIEALFEREYHTLVRLRHPRIVEAYGYGVAPEGPYYTMELLDGRDLKELAPLPCREVCQHLRDVASALALLHAHGLVHRDVSPRNVRLGQDGRAKLIDFGALIGFGVTTSVVGTPACIAPELLRRMPLDQRTDLYALGVIGYLALTGELPFPARRVEDLASLWQKAPPPPSARVDGVPPALDQLVLALLSIDPLARPSSAAAVIDQLTVIGDLPPDEHEQAAASYLLSGALVGREHEQDWMSKRIARALAGTGAQLLVSAGSGLGKTRLLHELSLLAQLRGMIALKADAQAVPEPFGVAARLGSELLMACPEEALHAAAPHAGLLVQLSAALRERLPDAPPVALALDPAERRARFQAALLDWFGAVARQRALFVAVDNVHAIDSSSAGFLAALGRSSQRARLVLLATEHSAEQAGGSEPLRALRKQAKQLKLVALSPLDCERLVQSLFGDVPNSRRLAKLLFEHSGGNPRHVLELAQLLVSKGSISYMAGTWVLPLEVDSSELPGRIDQLAAERLAALSATARDLIEALSVDGAPVSLERCIALCAPRSPSEVYAALDELVSERILVADQAHYRFAQQTLREAVLAQMDATRRCARHRQIAEELLANEPKHAGRVAAALHLLRAGDEARGADIIARAGRAYLRDSEVYDSSTHVLRALLSALQIYEKQGRSKYEIAGVLHPIVPLGFFVDWRAVREHGERGIAIGLEITGLARAGKLSRYVGKKLALAIGLGGAALKFRTLQQRGLDYDLKAAIVSLCAMVPGAVGAASIFFDGAAIARIARALEPIKLLGDPEQLPQLLYRFVEIQVLMNQGRVREASEALQALAPQFMHPRILAEIGEGQARGMYGGVLYCLAVMRCYQFGPHAFELAGEMDRLGVRTWAASAEQVRLLCHAMRGESEQVARCRERVEAYAVQGESTWQMEIFLPTLLLDANLLMADTIAARRNAEQLARRAAHAESLAGHARLAQAGYLGLRGELAAALAIFEEILPQFAPFSCPAWLIMRGHFADVLNRAGEHARAKQLLLEALAHSQPEDYVAVWQHLEPQRQLALAEAGLGDHAAAVKRLDELIARHGHEDNRLLIGLLHKARAEVALQQRDEPALRAHFAKMEDRFRATRTPALIAQVERFAARAELRAPPAPEHEHAVRDTSSVLSIQGSFAELTNSTDRYRHALALVLERTRARSGFLYMLNGDTFRLAAANSPSEPPIGMETELRESALRLRQGGEKNDEDDTRMVEQDAPGDASYQVLLLTTYRNREPVVVGGLILRESATAWVDAAFLDELASALQEREALSTGF